MENQDYQKGYEACKTDIKNIIKQLINAEQGFKEANIAYPRKTQMCEYAITRYEQLKGTHLNKLI